MPRSAWIILVAALLLVSCAPIHAVTPPPQPMVATTGATPAPEATTENEGNQQAIPSTASSDVSSDMTTPKSALEGLFSGAPLSPALFAPNFLSQVSVEQVQAIIASLAKSLGQFVRVEGDKSPFTVVFDSGAMVTDIALQDNGQIETLFFHPPILAVSSLETAVANFKQLPGELSLLVTKNGDPIASLDADKPLAVGSAFKLLVLKALRSQIEAGDHSWDEVILLKPQWKDLPTGILQTWPDNTPLTIQTLATLMISISDNTAADALIDTVGRQTLEALSPRNHPFLTVQELLKLKAKPNAGILENYRNANEATKRQILETLKSVPLPTVDEISSTPSLDVEWNFAANELCDLMAQVEDLDLMTVEPGPAGSQPGQWSRIAYKGGSERGVLNLTTWLENKSGDNYCVTITENIPNQDVDENQVVTLYSSLLSVLK